MLTVNMHEAKTQLSRLVDAALAGEEVVIARAGKAVVRLIPWEPAGAEGRRLGSLKGTISEEELRALLAPLPDDVVDALHGAEDGAAPAAAPEAVLLGTGRP